MAYPTSWSKSKIKDAILYVASQCKPTRFQYNGNTVYSDKLLRKVNYILYSSPSMSSTSGYSITTSSSINSCQSNSWNKEWNNGSITKAATIEQTGIITYTSTLCNETELKTIPKE